MYNKTVMELFQNPENCGLLHGANATSVVNHEQFGDAIKFYIRVDDNGVIEDASFKAFGSPALIACTSVIATLSKGKDINQALELTNEDILAEVKELPESKLYCLDFAILALKTTIDEYNEKLEKEEKRQNKKDKKEQVNNTISQVEAEEKQDLVEDLEQEEFEEVESDNQEVISNENLCSAKEEFEEVEAIESQLNSNEEIMEEISQTEELIVENQENNESIEEENLFDGFDDDEDEFFDDFDDEEIEDEIIGDGVEELYNKIFNFEEKEEKNTDIKVIDNADDTIFDE